MLAHMHTHAHANVQVRPTWKVGFVCAHDDALQQVRESLGHVCRHKEVLGRVEEDAVVSLLEQTELTDGGGEIAGHGPHFVLHRKNDNGASLKLSCLTSRNTVF